MGRPVQWLVEVSAQRDVSRDTLLMAVREAQAASANDALAAANDLLATDGPQGLAYEHAPSLLILVFVADVTPSEVEAVERSMLPLKRMAESHSLPASCHVECNADREQGLCDAARRFDAPRLFIGTRRTLLFRSASQAASTWAFCEAHLPPGCALTVVRGSRKLKEYVPHPSTLAAAASAKGRAPPHSQAPSQPQSQSQSQSQGAAAAALEPIEFSQSPSEASSGKSTKGAAPSTAASKFLRAFSVRARFESLDASRFLPHSRWRRDREGGGGAEGGAGGEGQGDALRASRSAPAVTPWRTGSLGTPMAGRTGTNTGAATLHSTGIGAGLGASENGAPTNGIAPLRSSLATASERFSHTVAASLTSALGPLGSSLRHSDRWDMGALTIPEWLEEEAEDEYGLDGTQSMHGGLRLGQRAQPHPAPQGSSPAAAAVAATRAAAAGKASGLSRLGASGGSGGSGSMLPAGAGAGLGPSSQHLSHSHSLGSQGQSPGTKGSVTVTITGTGASTGASMGPGPGAMGARGMAHPGSPHLGNGHMGAMQARARLAAGAPGSPARVRALAQAQRGGAPGAYQQVPGRAAAYSTGSITLGQYNSNDPNTIQYNNSSSFGAMPGRGVLPVAGLHSAGSMGSGGVTGGVPGADQGQISTGELTKLLAEVNKLQESALAAAAAAQRADQEARSAREESRRALAVAESEAQRRAQVELALHRQQMHAQQLAADNRADDVSSFDGHVGGPSGRSSEAGSPGPSEDGRWRTSTRSMGADKARGERSLFSPAGSLKAAQSRFFPGEDEGPVRRTATLGPGGLVLASANDDEGSQHSARNFSSACLPWKAPLSPSPSLSTDHDPIAADGAPSPASTSSGTHTSHSHSHSHSLAPGSDCRRFTAQQLEEATAGFCEATRLLGKGSYGSVYLGELHGCSVAIKRLAVTAGTSLAAADTRSSPANGAPGGPQGYGQGAREFQTEVEVLSRVRHPHVVLLMGHCPETQCLVYEFMAGGSLHDRLKGLGQGQAQGQGVASPAMKSLASTQGKPRGALTWPDRFRIAAEVSGALLFLHSHDPPILHRDLKPSNILLDAHELSKVSDVGLARLIVGPDGDQDGQEDSRPITIRGTMGYIDPDELATGELSTASDTYAFGLILLQMLTGITAVKQVHRLLDEAAGPGGLRATAGVQEALMARLDAGAGRWPRELAGELTRVALRCVERQREVRAGHARDVHPALLDLAARARAEKELRQQHMDSRFVCPLSEERMQDPVVAADGFTYERSHIQQWLEKSQLSPITGQPLPHTALTPNNTLAAVLQSGI